MRTLLVGALVAAVASLQSSTVRRPEAGSLVVTGRIITSSGPEARPVRRARVRLSGTLLNDAREAQTDTDGKYRFDRLPAGDYHLAVQKPGFVKLEADATPDAVFTMVRGGAIAGIVADASGDPLSNVAVSVLRQQSGGTTPTIAGETRTDDLGRYRIHSLDAGEYSDSGRV